MGASLKIERRLALSPNDCFALWTDPLELRKWWGPKDEAGEVFQAEIMQWDVRAGANWAINMIAPDGTVYRQGGEMIEVDPPNLIRFSFHWVENGMRGPRTEVTVTFDRDAKGTLLRFQQSGFADVNIRDGHYQGWKECLDRFVDLARQEMIPG